ncbi:MAG TPA: hypothetical protein VFH71_04125 [Rhodanobacteraceae bacterium]|nr:hypothetical protein [Rhodanobacteraceae bacterium]
MKGMYSSMIFLASACVFVAACGEQHNSEFSASATAEQLSNGSVKIRSSTSGEKADVEEAIKKRDAIDSRLPGSSIPLNAPSSRVTEVTAPGILQLADGRKIRLDGIRCENTAAIGYLRRILRDKSVSVIFLPSGQKISPIPAEVWMVDTGVQSATSSPAYSNLNETAITSGWCQVEATPTSKHNARYAALAKAFQGASGH